MPRPAKPARLHRRADDGMWVILDRGKHKRTGTRNREQAETALATHIANKTRVYSPDPTKITVAACIEIYCREHAPTVAAPERIGYAAIPLLDFWQESPVSHVKANMCRAYAKQRNVSDGTTRRELTTLRAALNYCYREGYLLTAPPVWLPTRPPSRERWLTRDEAAKLLWTAYRSPQGKHLARFILISLYTGTRKAAVLRLRYVANTHGGHIDTAQGVLYRRGEGERQTDKRRPPARLPKQILAHARRWEKEGGRYVVEWNGEATKNNKKSWSTAIQSTGLQGVTPHTLKHTAITWALQRGASIWDCAGYFGTSAETIERTYGHHSPDYQDSAVKALEG